MRRRVEALDQAGLTLAKIQKAAHEAALSRLRASSYAASGATAR